MHTFRHGRFAIHYNSDMSGDCQIVDTTAPAELTVPAVMLLDFVAQHVARWRIAALEQATTAELLGIPAPQCSSATAEQQCAIYEWNNGRGPVRTLFGALGRLKDLGLVEFRADSGGGSWCATEAGEAAGLRVR